MKTIENKPRSEKDTEMLFDLMDLVKKHWPDGQMPLDSIVVTFGMLIAASMATRPLEERKRVAKYFSQEIIRPSRELRELADQYRNTIN